MRVTAPSTPRASALPLFLVLLVAAVVRLLFALHKGLVLDEFHTYFHAGNAPWRAGWNAFWEPLVLDNHPPLSFLAVGVARSWLGDAEWALRLPALLAGLAEIALVGLIASRLPGRQAVTAAALLAASSLHQDFSTQARMYAWLALAVTGCVLALTHLYDEQRPSTGRLAAVALVLFATLGAHAHYFFLQYAAWSLVVTACWALARGRQLRRLLAPCLVIALLCAPWYATGFREQLLAHQLEPGGKDVGLMGLAESLVHLFFLNLRVGGPVLWYAFLAGAGLVLLLAGWGALALLRERPRDLASWLLPTVAFAVPAGAAGLASSWPRAGFTWHYVLPSAAAVALLAAQGVRSGPLFALRRVAFGTALALAATLSLLQVSGPGTEDFPGAIGWIQEGLQPGDAVVAVEYQPRLFPQHQPWQYYAPRLGWSGPEPLPMLDFDQLRQERDLDGHPRIWLLRTDLPDQHPILRQIRERGTAVSSREFGYGVQAACYERR